MTRCATGNTCNTPFWANHQWEMGLLASFVMGASKLTTFVPATWHFQSLKVRQSEAETPPIIEKHRWKSNTKILRDWEENEGNTGSRVDPLQSQEKCNYSAFLNLLTIRDLGENGFCKKIKHFPKEDFIFQSSTCSHKQGCKLKCLNLSKGLIHETAWSVSQSVIASATVGEVRRCGPGPE